MCLNESRYKEVNITEKLNMKCGSILSVTSSCVSWGMEDMFLTILIFKLQMMLKS